MIIKPDVHRGRPSRVFLAYKSRTTGYYDEGDVNKSFKEFVLEKPHYFFNPGEYYNSFNVVLSGTLVVHGEWL